MQESVIHYEIAKNAPCIFCAEEPTTTANVWLGSKVRIGESTETKLKNAPCCQRCSTKYSSFMRNWIIATILSGQIFSFIFVFFDPFGSGIYSKEGIGVQIIGSVFLGIIFTIPVGILFRIILQATYAKKAKNWIKKYASTISFV